MNENIEQNYVYCDLFICEEDKDIKTDEYLIEKVYKNENQNNILTDDVLDREFKDFYKNQYEFSTVINDKSNNLKNIYEEGINNLSDFLNTSCKNIIEIQKFIKLHTKFKQEDLDQAFEKMLCFDNSVEEIIHKFRIIIEINGDLNNKNNNENAIFKACIKKNIEICEAILNDDLIMSKFNINEKNIYSLNLIDRVVSLKLIKNLQIILRKFSETKELSLTILDSIFKSLYIEDSFEIFKLLIEYIPDKSIIKYHLYDGENIIHKAINNKINNTEIINYLVNLTPDILTMKSQYNELPIQKAILNNNIHYINLLAELMNKNHMINELSCVFFTFVFQNVSYEYIKIIIKNGGNPNVRYNKCYNDAPDDNETPLHKAVYQNDQNKILNLINIGAKITIYSNFDENPCDKALNLDKIKMYKLMNCK